LKKDLALHLFCDDAIITKYLDMGIIKRDKNGKYDLDACRKGVLKYFRGIAQGKSVNAGGPDLSTERAKLAVSQRERIDRENAVAAGEYVLVSVVGEMVDFAFSTARERMLSLIGVLAPLLVSAERPLHVVEDILRDRFYEALDGLANFDFRTAWGKRQNTAVTSPSVRPVPRPYMRVPLSTGLWHLLLRS
jgi:hypothetical protein